MLRLVLSIMIMLVAGCAGTTTGITAFSNPDVAPPVIKKLYVDIRGYPIETQVAAENSAEHSLRRYRVEAMGRTKLMPPYREYSPSEIEQKLAQSVQ